MALTPKSTLDPDGPATTRLLADPPIGAYTIDGAGALNFKSNTVDLPHPIRGFEITPGGTAGDVKVICGDGSTFTWPTRAVGSRTSCCIVRVFDTGTTAVGIIGLR